MSVTSVKSYFRARCIASGLTEHTDGFNEANVAFTVIDKAFHILLGTFSGRKLNQNDQEIDCPVTVSFWINGYNDPADGIDRAVQLAETLIKETLKNSNRLGQSIKNVVFNTMSLEPLDGSTDNTVKVTISFTALVSMAIT